MHCALDIGKRVEQEDKTMKTIIIRKMERSNA